MPAAVQHVEERDDHFVVTEDGKTFPVPKAGLDNDTLTHLQGMAHAHALAGGGIRVDSDGASPGDPEGGPKVEETEQKPDPDDTPPPQEPIHMAAGGGVPDAGFRQADFQPLQPFGAMDAGPPIQWLTPDQPNPMDLFQAEGGGFTARPDAGSVALTPAEMAAPPIEQRHTLPPKQAALDDWKKRNPGEALTTPTPGSEALPAGWSLNAPGAILGGAQPPAPSAQPPSGTPGLPSGGGGGALTELNRGLAEQRAGLAAQVEAEKAKDAALVALQDSHIQQMQALEQRSAEQYQAHQQRAESMFQAVMNQQIDPNRIWANADLGQRMAAGVGILLSGIGQSMGGGPNLALQQINLTIDRDIAAQKFNLEKGENLLTHYLQQGRDMMSAQQMAKADLKDLFAAQMLRTSAEFGGQEAAARAQMAGGQLRTEAAQARQQIIGRQFAMDKERLSMQLAMEQQRLMNSFLHQQPTAGGPGLQVDDPAIWDWLPKEKREARVRLPNGKWAFAKDGAQASKLQEGIQAADEMKRGLARFTSLLDSGSPKLWTWAGGDMSAGEELLGMLTAKLKEAQKLGAMSESDYKLISGQIPDITSWRTSQAGSRQKLNGLGQSIDDAVMSHMATLGVF